MMSKQTSDKHREQLSAFVDGEVPPSQAEKFGSLSDDPHSRTAWQCYHLLRDVMQSEYRGELPLDFASRVQKSLADEPLPSATVTQFHAHPSVRSSRTRRWLPAAGLAVAASLVAMTVVSFNLFRDVQPPLVDLAGELPIGTRVVGSSQPLPRVVGGNAGTRWRIGNDEVASDPVVKRLNSLLTNHLEGAGISRVQGMLSHARVAGYDREMPDKGSF